MGIEDLGVQEAPLDKHLGIKNNLEGVSAGYPLGRGEEHGQAAEFLSNLGGFYLFGRVSYEEFGKLWLRRGGEYPNGIKADVRSRNIGDEIVGKGDELADRHDGHTARRTGLVQHRDLAD